MHITNEFSCLKTACFVQLQTSGNKKCSLNYTYLLFRSHKYAFISSWFLDLLASLVTYCWTHILTPCKNVRTPFGLPVVIPSMAESRWAFKIINQSRDIKKTENK